MAEELVLTDPIVTAPVSTEKYRVRGLLLDLDGVGAGLVVVSDPPEPPQPGLVRITLRDNHDVASQYEYTGTQAVEMMKWMNTANFSVNSMQKRVLQKLTQDGKLPPGNVTGTPDTPAADEG